MFGQLVPWHDCANNCVFCSQRDIRENLTLAEKRKRLMKAASWLTTNAGAYDRFGLIGGELFDTDGLTREWRCVAEAISAMPCEVIFIASHLIGDMGNMMDFLSYIPKERTVTICTSYDAVGRFHSEEDLALWQKNLATLHENGYGICCTCILTQDLVEQDELPIPDYVHITLVEPLPRWSYWYTDYVPDRDGECHARLLSDMDGFPLRLPNRKDTLRWLSKHKKAAAHYADYNTSHSDDIYEYIDGAYVPTSDDRFARPQCDCGHQYSARCYADSPKCVQCDLKEMFEW